ncbi:hypothetical protein EG68_10482 [Paragonimus skrjabini miyazakii]|uniref:Uncharacterized protein n=1 Tax=Paragonimus skrjabini miyazakii TaxID=59628 RepID=A0A8S9YE62_9TREM|nr:hypothetical protein EG68_10482 [Paragonimus skrjabini miyazakii]
MRQVRPSGADMNVVSNPCGPSDPVRGPTLPYRHVHNRTSSPTNTHASDRSAPNKQQHFSSAQPMVDEQQHRREMPTAPLPSRKQRTMSPPTQFYPTAVTQFSDKPGYQASSQYILQPTDRSILRSALPNQPSTPLQRQQPLELQNAMHGEAVSTNSSFVSDRNSGGSSDITTPSSPLRRTRPSTFQDSASSVTAASGPKSTTHHASRELMIPQATVVRAPTTSAQLTGTSEIVNSSVAASHRLCGTRAASPPGCSNKTSIPTADYGLKMTVSELRSVAERQRQQLTRQAQQLQTKEERLAWLRSVRSRASGDGSSGVDKLPVPGCELSHDQEMRLHKLRSFRGQTEQTRLTNEHIGMWFELIDAHFVAFP